MTCPICQEPSRPVAASPFGKACNGTVESPLPDVEYHQCQACGFTWAPALYSKPPEWFAENIYNTDYPLFDPEYGGARAANQARQLTFAFSWARKQIRHLDFGGGQGLLSEKLRANGFDSTSYDPFNGDAAPEGVFNLITCFEVFEHVPGPRGLIAQLAGFLDSPGIIFASTLLIEDEGIADWWYAAPRNGHISLYTAKALQHLAREAGLKHGIGTADQHFFRELPTWAG